MNETQSVPPILSEEEDRFVNLMTLWTAKGAYSKTEMLIRLHEVASNHGISEKFLLDLVELKRTIIE